MGICLVILAVNKIIIGLRLSSMVLSSVGKIFIVTWFHLVANQIMDRDNDLVRIFLFLTMLMLDRLILVPSVRFLKMAHHFMIGVFVFVISIMIYRMII